MTDLTKHRILDCEINRTEMPQALQSVAERVAAGSGGYVCFANVHTVVTARNDTRLRDATNQAFMAMPDGAPLAAVARRRGFTDIQRVAGPDFMWHMLDQHRHLRHFFYGSTERTLEKLSINAAEAFPGLQIVGTLSPPFRTLDADEIETHRQQLAAASADIVWIGLGAPKQEYWMADNWQALQPALLLGVGAAFDFHDGTKPRAPLWMQRASLEWLFRLVSEPRRLARRYLQTNSKFFYYLVSDWFKRR